MAPTCPAGERPRIRAQRVRELPEMPELPERPDESAGLADDARLATHLRTLERIHLGLAHDLRAPLNAAVLNIELLRRALADDAPPEFAQRRGAFLGVIEKELGRVRSALEALLVEFAPGRGVQDHFDLRELLDHVGRLLAAQARQQRLTLVVDAPDEPVAVVADRDALRQAILQLAVAALERAAAGGGVRLILEQDLDSARLRITGGGSGAARLDAVARAIVEEQGGRVAILDDVPPEGPGVVVALPLARAQARGAPGR
jgi:signal transduction histidine kinase